MHPKAADKLPVGPQWRYELKLDGYRALAIKTATGVKLISRNEKDLSSRYSEILDGIQSLPVREAVFDGEIVALDASGKPSFQDLQHVPAPGRADRSIVYFAFDLLNLERKALISLASVERKRLLRDALATAPGTVRFVPFFEGEPDDIVAAVKRACLEGIVAKSVNGRYEPGQRSGLWRKLKIGHEQEFVIGGYTLGQGGRSAFSSLIVGYYDGGKLCYASKVGTGFSFRLIRELHALAMPLRQLTCPFDNIPRSAETSWSHGLTAAEVKTATWLRPVLVCRVRFTEWTRDGCLRHPAFQGMRGDKEASEVLREERPDNRI